MTSDRKTLFIKTYGCQMNVYDSDRMAEAAYTAGYDQVDKADNADLVILNTCHIRDKAAEKVYSDLGRLKKAKTESGHEQIIGVAGCVAQAEGQEIIRRAPVVDFVVGPQDYQGLPNLINKAKAGQKPVASDFSAEEKFATLPKRGVTKRPLSAGRTAFLTIQEGCDKFCTFCVVPYTRGAEFSRPVADIVAEARELAALGVCEITLLGQNVNAYAGSDEKASNKTVSLAGLLERLSDIDGLERLRYTTSHPRDMGDDLIEAHKNLPKLMPYLHLPIQSGSDRILAAMNRKHTVAEYHKIIDKLRLARPDIALTSDFIVGFPGESDDDFDQTMRLVKDIGFASAYSFKYSPRPGTPAALRDHQVDGQVMAQRLTELQAQLEADRQKFNQACLNQTMPVLLDKPGRYEGQLVGRSPYLQSVHVVMPQDRLGTIIPLKMISVGATSLEGEAA